MTDGISITLAAVAHALIIGLGLYFVQAPFYVIMLGAGLVYEIAWWAQFLDLKKTKKTG